MNPEDYRQPYPYEMAKPTPFPWDKVKRYAVDGIKILVLLGIVAGLFGGIGYVINRDGQRIKAFEAAENRRTEKAMELCAPRKLESLTKHQGYYLLTCAEEPVRTRTELPLETFE